MAGPTASIRWLHDPGHEGVYLGFLLLGGGIMTWGETRHILRSPCEPRQARAHPQGQGRGG